MERIVVLLIKPILFLTPLAVAVFIALEESVPRRTGLILSWNTEQVKSDTGLVLKSKKGTSTSFSSRQLQLLIFVAYKNSVMPPLL